MATATPKPRLDVTVTKPTPYTFDLGILLATDANPVARLPRGGDLDATVARESALAALARDGAQALVNQLLTTCEVRSSKATAGAGDGGTTQLVLPARSTALPREKPLPAAKAKTKWETFAARKGIKPKTREARANRVWDEEKGGWASKWGYGGKNKGTEKDWLVEVDPRKEAELGEGETLRGAGRRERKERVKRNDRLMRRNEKRGADGVKGKAR